MKAKKRVVEAVLQRTTAALVTAMESSISYWPLPLPPRQDADFPTLVPSRPEQLVKQALGLFQADRGGFENHLISTVELVVPYRMGLSENVFEEHEKWLMRRLDDVSERILFATCTTWLAEALDPSTPDTDKWWLSISLLCGLANKPDGQPVHQGYHLLESIALAERPGTWHTQPQDGPHNVGWNPHAIVPRSALTAHHEGAQAARWMLEKLEQGDASRRLLLIEWIMLLLERRELVEPLALPEIILRRAADPDDSVAARLVATLPRLLESDKESGLAAIKILSAREDVSVQRALADVLTRLFRRIEWDAVPLLEKMLASDDENILAAASSTVGDLRFLDDARYADEVSNLADHPVPIVRRNLVSTLRYYITNFPEDERRVILRLWLDGDEVVAARLRELFIRMEEVDPDSFGQQISRIDAEDKSALEYLWKILEIRNAGRPQAWMKWLSGEGEVPATTPPKPVERGPQTNIEVDLPQLSDALDTLDGGNLD